MSESLRTQPVYCKHGLEEQESKFPAAALRQQGVGGIEETVARGINKLNVIM